MRFLIKIFTNFVLVVSVRALQHDLPSYFPRCKRYDPKLNECLLNATEQVKPFLIKGIPELGLHPLEPLHVPEITLQQGTQALNFKAQLKNISVSGLGSYKFSQFDFDVPNLQWFCKATIDSLVLNGRYEVTGKILVAPIEGNGNFVATVRNINITAYQKVETFERKGEQFLRPIVTNTSIEVGGPKVTLDGLFDGSDEISEYGVECV